MKKLLLGATALAALAGAANAADLKATPQAVFKAPPLSLVDPYTGFYIGGAVGYGWDRGNLGASFPGGPADFGDLSNAPQGFMGGGYVGLGTRIPGFLAGLGLDGYVGAEAQGYLGNLSGTAATPGMLVTTNGATGGIVATTNDNWFARTVLRLGLIYQNVMFFGDAGYAWGDTALNLTNGANGNNVGSNSMTNSGFTWGLGIEFPWFFGPNWKARVEYMQMDFGTNAACILTTCNTPTPIVATQKDRIDAVMAGVNYKF